MKTSLGERETHFDIVADNRAQCDVCTDDPVWREWLCKRFQPYKVDGDTAYFRVPTKLVIRESALSKGNETLRRTAERV